VISSIVNIMSTTATLATQAHELQNQSSAVTQLPHESGPWDEPGHTLGDASPPKPSNLRIAGTILQLASVNLLSSYANGVLTVGLPTIARDLELARELYLWPLSVFGLTCGSMLLLAGSITDVVGARRVELVGIFMLGIFMLACGLADTGVQLTLFRAFQGVAMAVHLPAAVSIVASTMPKGRARNMAFAAMGFARDIGFSVGLVLSGVLIQAKGWRLNFYLAGGGMLLLGAVAVWGLPMAKKRATASGGILKELYHSVDWVGAIITSGGLALLAYVLA
jgi:MFS family permease